MSEIEQELIDVTSFEPQREYGERQDYLAAVTRAVNKISDVDFNTLSNDAAEWFNDAVKAIKDRKDIPDFPDREESEDEVVEKPAEPAPAAKTKSKSTEPKRRGKGVPPRKLEHPPIDPQASIENFETDRYGVVKGSKNAAAVAMLEKGCRMSDITASIGGTYYNLVARLQKSGHKIDKAANGGIKLTHKDD